jgi:hypothetical protein
VPALPWKQGAVVIAHTDEGDEHKEGEQAA